MCPRGARVKRVPLKRKPFRRKPPTATEKPKAPLSRQRLKKAAADAEYRVQREMRLVRARGICELQAPGCTRVATETHHVIKRSTIVVHDVENLRACCHNCNQWVELNPIEAARRGWVIRKWPQIEG